MRLLFSEVCSLLSRYEDIELRDPPLLWPTEKATQLTNVTECWFKSHRRFVSESSASSSVALLSALLPERRTDRVYDIQAARLCRILSRALSLGSTRTQDLIAYTRPGHGDLAICVERVLKAGGPPALPPVTLDEIDAMLQTLAGHSRFSDPSISGLPPGSAEVRDQLLGRIFIRLSPEEGRWLVRTILKDLSPVRVDERSVLKCFHFLLPDLLLFQNDLTAVMALLKGPLREYPGHPDPRSENLHRQSVARLLVPVVGIKVGRPNYHKARSIDHCMGLIGRRQWVLERKYDGEYCEIHIDLQKSSSPSECIKIFSKSGKDSTRDRSALHQVLVDAFKLGSAESKIKRQAILLGELVVYSDKDNEIMPFEEIRKHIRRSGTSIGTKEDSLPSPQEHLAIVLFDLLLHDDENVMAKSVEERRSCLRKIYRKIPGRAIGAEWKIVDFEDPNSGRKRLMEQFAASISRRSEGLVLKPCGVSFFGLDPKDYGIHSFIKLKKDYMANLGDEADFAVVGASFNAQQALRSSIPSASFTSFHLGCLTNKEEVLRLNDRAIFKFVCTISGELCIPKAVFEAAHALGKFIAKPFDPDVSPSAFDLSDARRVKMDVHFDEPFVFEVLGSGFTKPSNASFMMLRHPRVKKLHQDRTWRDCISFQELQDLAVKSRAHPVESESQETLKWIRKLERKCTRKFQREQTTTPQTRTTSTSSPRARPADKYESSSRIAEEYTALITMHHAPHPIVISDATEERAPAVYSGDGSRKRSRQSSHLTPCPAPKRRWVESRLDEDNMAAYNLASTETPPPNGKVLSDITVSATNSASPRYDTCGTQDAIRDIEQDINDMESSKHSPAIARHHDPSLNRCGSGEDCIFTNATIYLAPCISTMPYILEDLLPTHSTITLTCSLKHWDRDTFGHGTLTETVAESQSHPGNRKIVFVESRRRSAVLTLVKEILALNGGVFREQVAFYDWRALEDCIVDHYCPGSGGFDVDVDVRGLEARRKKHFLGSTMVDMKRGRTVFVSDREWLQLSSTSDGLSM